MDIQIKPMQTGAAFEASVDNTQAQAQAQTLEKLSPGSMPERKSGSVPERKSGSVPERKCGRRVATCPGVSLGPCWPF